MSDRNARPGSGAKGKTQASNRRTDKAQGTQKSRNRLKKTPKGLMARLAAARLIEAVYERGQALEAALDEGRTGFARLTPDDRALARAIASTALRHGGEIDRVLHTHLSGSILHKAPFLKAIWHGAIAQILFMDVPNYAAVSLAVDCAAHDHKAKHFKSVVNGVLRSVIRDSETFKADPTHYAPDWLRTRLKADYGADKAASILTAQAHEAPLDVTVADNPKEWANTLDGVPIGQKTVRLAKGRPVHALPNYKDGKWWVQDAAASVPADLLISALSDQGAPKEQRILDACAAPGGKAAQLAKAGFAVTALDQSANRMRRLQENMARLNLDVTLVVDDLLDYTPAEPFDGILLDAPCSATGTVRRHPDVMWLKRAAQLDALVSLQRAMLTRAATWLKPGGVLIYCTCSLLKAEGEAHIPFMLDDLGLIKRDIAPNEVALCPQLTLQDGHFRSTPDMNPGPSEIAGGMDGFFAVRLMRP